jgi:hypothetical protein
MMGGNTPETCSAVNKRQDNMLYQVGDLFELNVKLRCQKVNGLLRKPKFFTEPDGTSSHLL